MQVKPLIFSAGLFIAFNVTTIDASDTIHWQTIHFPPLTILKGPDRGKGQLDHFMPYLQKQLPQYKHTNVEMNWARTFKMIEKGDHNCSSMVFKSAERESIAEFSVPVAVALPIRIIMSKENIARLDNPNSYSLAKLIGDERFFTSLVLERSYTPAIDELLTQQHSASNFDRKAITSESLLQMLKFDRVNYMLEYPSTISYLSRNDAEFRERFSSLAIEEAAELAVTYLACPRSDWGKQVIENINRVVIEKHASNEYINLISRYYNRAEVKVIREGLRATLSNKE